MGSEMLPSTIYFMGSETLPSATCAAQEAQESAWQIPIPALRKKLRNLHAIAALEARNLHAKSQ